MPRHVWNSDGRLELHCAVIHGKTWNGGVSALGQAYRPALETPDEIPGLLPFMLSGQQKSILTPRVWASTRQARSHVEFVPQH